MSNQYRIPPATFRGDSYQYLARQIKERFVMIGLLGGLYGVLTILCLLSFYALARRKELTSAILGLALLGLYASTTIHMVTNILFHLSSILSAIVTANTSLWSYGGYSQWSAFPTEVVRDYSRAQSCATTAALTVNITLGDAIVCWRACVVWHKNRAVTAACGALVSATFALGVAATALSCNARNALYTECATLFTTGVMYERFPAGIAACALSLATNGAATLLVAYKAWESRTRLRGYLVTGPRAAQVEKLLTLLVESGAVYSALWVAIVAFQVSEYAPQEGGRVSGPAVDSFLDIFAVVVNGALVPAIAIYPALVVVLVALDRSHIEKVFMDNDQGALDAFQLDALAVEAGAGCSTQERPYPTTPRRAGVLLIDAGGLSDSGSSDDSSPYTDTSDQRKAEEMV